MFFRKTVTVFILHLQYVTDYQRSKLFSNASEEILNILGSRNVTWNYHQFCFSVESFENLGLTNNWQILSTNKDIHGIEFISVIESKNYPFYGVQFHPEKNLFEFKQGHHIPHNKEAVLVSQYFANFFVEECRKNNHSWVAANDLIYNFSPRYTGIFNSSYEQLYVFKEEDNNRSLSQNSKTVEYYNNEVFE